MNKRLVFMGSPEFAIPTLRALVENYRVIGVVTQPDRPAGRGRSLKPPPIKTLADEMGIPIIQPVRLTDSEAKSQLKRWSPDLIVVAAFGQILKPEILTLPHHGCMNVHASLLPRWRGAAPIQAAILNGDAQTGTSIMLMDAGLDTGPIISQREIQITPADTAGSLSTRLSESGAELLIETLPAYLEGDLLPYPQDDTLATYAPMLKKAEGQLNFTHPAENLARRVRAFNPWPGTFMNWGHSRLKIHRAYSVKTPSTDVGQTVIHDGLPAVITGEGILVLVEVQPAGKNSMPGEVFLRGARGWAEES
jgi:methionyl-tRNA formyltransferase